MGFFSVCLYSLTLIHVYLSTLAIARVIVSPSSQNVFEGDYAVFNCSGANISFLTWTFNDVMIKKFNEGISLQTMLIDDTIHSSLIVLALPKYNASSIMCVQYIDFHDADEFPAFLYIQGLLNSVSNFSIQFGTRYFRLSWDAPFSLAGLAVSYNLTIHDQSFKSEFLTTSKYIVPSSNFTPCHKYKISVAAINEVGMGNTSVITETIPAKLSAVAAAKIVSIVSNPATNTISANISVPVNLFCVIQEYTHVVAETLSGNVTENIPLLYDVDFKFANVTLLELPPDTTLNISLSISTTIDTVIQFLNLSTYDTQSLQVTNHFNDTICFNCSLIRNSAARGCKMIIESNDDHNTCYQSQSKFFVLYDMREVCFDGIFSGSYVIIVYDIDIDDATLLSPAISKEFQVLGKDCPLQGATTIDNSRLPVSTEMESTMIVLPSTTVTVKNSPHSGEKTATILVSVFACLITVIIIMTITLLLYLRICIKTGNTTTKENEPCSTLKIQTVEEANKYIKSIRNDESIYSVPESPPTRSTVVSIPSKYKKDKPYRLSDDEEEYVLMHSAGCSSLASSMKHTNDNEYVFSQVPVHCKYAQHLKSTYNSQDDSIL